MLEPAVVYGYWPATPRATTLVLLDPRPDPTAGGGPVHLPAPAHATAGCAWPTSSGPKESGELDVVGLQLVTIGEAVSEVHGEAVRPERLPGLPGAARAVGAADRGAGRVLARARARRAGHAAARTPTTLDGILDLGYRGARYSFGYPACPDLEYRADMVRLLDADRVGVVLSEELQLHPEQSTDALVVHHPEAKYFNAR
jgi:5-methyltetrahydrofolate--homocysteine methyltransferase